MRGGAVRTASLQLRLRGYLRQIGVHGLPRLRTLGPNIDQGFTPTRIVETANLKSDHVGIVRVPGEQRGSTLTTEPAVGGVATLCRHAVILRGPFE